MIEPKEPDDASTHWKLCIVAVINELAVMGALFLPLEVQWLKKG